MELPWQRWLSGDAHRNAMLASGIVVGGLATWYLWKRYQDSQLPPGPRGWPIIPTKDLMRAEDFHEKVLELRDKYGDVFSFYSGSSLIILISSYAALKEAFITEGDVFACRPINRTVTDHIGLKDDIFATPYQTKGWNENKAFLVTTFRGAVFGGSCAAENKVLNIVEELVSRLEMSADKGEAVNLCELLPRTTTKLTFMVLFNQHFDYDDPELDKVGQVLRDWLATAEQVMFLDSVPRILHTLFYRSVLAHVKRKTEDVRDLIRNQFNLHVKSHDPQSPRDFLDMYIAKKSGEHDIDRMIDNVLTFTPDSSGTLAHGMQWVALYITHHKYVQKEMLSEIIKLTGGNRSITWADHKQLPYTEAVIMEVLRIRTPFPMTADHAVSQNIVFRGYKIPTTARIFGSIHAIHRDPAVYTNPEEFQPERFLDSNGELTKQATWIPFGMGRRKCIGEQIARMGLFLLAANLVQRYSLDFAGENKPSLKPVSGDNIFLTTQPFEVVLSAHE